MEGKVKGDRTRTLYSKVITGVFEVRIKEVLFLSHGSFILVSSYIWLGNPGILVIV